MVAFKQHSRIGRAIEVVRWVGVYPAAFLAGMWTPIPYAGEAVFVLVGALFAPRFRQVVAVSLAALIAVQSLILHAQTGTILGSYFLLDLVSAAAGVAIVFCMGLIPSNEKAGSEPREEKAKLILTALGVSALVILTARHYWSLSEAKHFDEQYRMSKSDPIRQEQRCESHLRDLAEYLDEYHREFGEYPSDEIAPGYIQDFPYGSADPWNNDYRYQQISEDQAKIWSVGPDGVTDTGDDSTVSLRFGASHVVDSLFQRNTRARIELHKARAEAQRP